MNLRETVGRRTMTEDDWSVIKNFTKEEVAAGCQDGQWQQVDAGSLFVLDDFAGYVANDQRLVKSVAFMPTRISQGPHKGKACAIWNTPDSKAHSADSLHYKGRAFDVMFPRNALATAWLTATRYHRWGGIGAYPFWRPDPGLHLDTRWAGGAEQGPGFRVMWFVDEGGQYHYLNTEEDIMLFLTLLRSAG